jgi:hypothetical protein
VYDKVVSAVDGLGVERLEGIGLVGGGVQDLVKQESLGWDHDVGDKHSWCCVDGEKVEVRMRCVSIRFRSVDEI